MNTKTLLSISYILSYFAIGLSIYNHIFMSLFLYFISATMLGLIIFNSTFTLKSNRFILLALALLYTIMMIKFCNNLTEISYSLLISLVWHAAYTLLYIYVFSSLDQDIKKDLAKLIVGMNILLITLLLVCQIYFNIFLVQYSILTGYWNIVIFISSFSCVVLSQIKFSFKKAYN